MIRQVSLFGRRIATTPALNCLFLAFIALPLFVWQWYYFDRLLAQPDTASVVHTGVIAFLNGLSLSACLINVLVVLWLWPRRRRPEPVPLASLISGLPLILTYMATNIAFGPATSPVTLVSVSTLVLGLALLEWRVVALLYLISLMAYLIGDVLVLSGVLPHAPAFVPGTFSEQGTAAWWDFWRRYLFFFGLPVSFLLLIWPFAHLDRQRERLEALSCMDALTGLSNRRHFMERLGQEQYRRDRYQHAFSVVLCDADHFKQVNDSYGHHAGDEVLRFLGRLLNGSLRIPGDVAARLGGEEFALLLTECSESEARTVCERLRQQLRAHEFEVDGRCFRVTLSMGAVECVTGSGEEALKAADQNLYRAKREGRDRVVTSMLMRGS